LDLHHTWPTGPGRHTALTRLLARVTTDLGTAAGLPTGRQLQALRPFLSLGILGVIRPLLLAPNDPLLLMAKLALRRGALSDPGVWSALEACINATGSPRGARM